MTETSGAPEVTGAGVLLVAAIAAVGRGYFALSAFIIYAVVNANR